MEIDDRLLLGPAYRADVVIDFPKVEGESLLLHNDAPSPFGGETGEDQDDVQPLPEVMLFDVEEKRCKRNRSRIRKRLGRVPELRRSTADRERELTLVEGEDEYDRLELELGTRENPNGLGWDAPVTETPELGSTKI